MRLTWREQLSRNPHYRDFGNWPSIPTTYLKKSQRKLFLRNRLLIGEVLAGKPLKEAAKNAQLSIGRVSQILDRALGSTDDHPPALTAGLIPGRVLKKKKRKTRAPSLGAATGATCAFQQLLTDVPGLQAGLDAMLKAAIRDRRYAQVVTPHGHFMGSSGDCWLKRTGRRTHTRIPAPLSLMNRFENTSTSGGWSSSRRR